MKAKLLIATLLSLSLLTLGVNAQSTTNPDSLSQRIQERKARLQEHLTAAEQARVELRCQNAQTRIANAREIAVKFNENHDKKIQNLLDRLSDFSKRQKNKGADTVVLDTVLNDLLQKDEAVKTAYDSYISALDDASNVDCQADPTGFMASLDDARTQFQSLRTARQTLRKTLKDDLLKALEDFKLKEGA